MPHSDEKTQFCYVVWSLQVQQPGHRAEGQGHHHIMLASFSGHWPDTDAGLEQRYVIIFKECFNNVCLQQFLPAAVLS